MLLFQLTGSLSIKLCGHEENTVRMRCQRETLPLSFSYNFLFYWKFTNKGSTTKLTHLPQSLCIVKKTFYSGPRLVSYHTPTKQRFQPRKSSFLSKRKSQAEGAYKLSESTDFKFDEIENTQIATGFAFGRYCGQLFRPYSADALIGFAALAKKVAVTALYPHWSAAADYVDRTPLPSTDTPFNHATPVQCRAGKGCVYGFFPGIVPNLDYTQFTKTTEPETEKL